MAQLEMTFAVLAVLAGSFLAWLYTKLGKKSIMKRSHENDINP